jgi:hypothetical protein
MTGRAARGATGTKRPVSRSNTPTRKSVGRKCPRPLLPSPAPLSRHTIARRPRSMISWKRASTAGMRAEKACPSGLCQNAVRSLSLSAWARSPTKSSSKTLPSSLAASENSPLPLAAASFRPTFGPSRGPYRDTIELYSAKDGSCRSRRTSLTARIRWNMQIRSIEQSSLRPMKTAETRKPHMKPHILTR